jgi:ATP-dependent DNA helicase DinG
MNSATFLSEKGPLAPLLPGFSKRQVQQDMAAAIEDAIRQNKKLVVEAPTGTGKTLAYLVPALLSGKKIVISTGTKNLQDQLFLKDLPLLQKALKHNIKIALLKGRANYLCHYRLALGEEEGRFHSKQTVADLMEVKRWAEQTSTGDIAELHTVSEDSSVWGTVTSTNENCLGTECDFYEKCHLVKARRKALSAELVVINHHLFFADLKLKDAGFGELLPGVDVVVLDEAHQLPDIATNFFGDFISSRQINNLLTDIELEYTHVAGQFSVLQGVIERIKLSLKKFRLALGEDLRRAAWHSVSTTTSVQEANQMLQEELLYLKEVLQPLESNSPGLAKCLERCAEILSLLKQVTDVGEEADKEEVIRWFETFSRTFSLQLSLLNPAEQMKKIMQTHGGAWIFTSATLAVGGDFSHFTSQLGLEDSKALQFDSPFAYDKHAVMYLPASLPLPQSPDYQKAFIEAALPLINAYQGRTFLLFTSYRALKNAATELVKLCDFPLLVQGETTKRKLLERFVEYGNAILLGTSSFWEGVDVRGAALSCVIIDKLPFASPGDPIMQARIDLFRKKGKDPFQTYQLPTAVIALKQGAGRLIRDTEDKGVLMIGDTRLLQKSYGRVFLESLPKMMRTRDEDKVIKFIAYTQSEKEAVHENSSD